MSKFIIRIIIFIAITGLFPGLLSAQSDYKLAEQDSLALVAFYWATDGPDWKSNQDGFGFDDLSSEWQGIYDGGYNKWLEGPAKDWFGVRVEKMPIPNSTDSAYRVTWLWPVVGRRTDGQNFLEGYIPREVAFLTALKEFRVNGNNGFEWEEIPDDLYHKSLEWLDIESCYFGGGISDAFRNCTNIRKMNFRYNYIDYMPNLDFLDEEALYNLAGTQWFYSTRLSFAIIEEMVDYFYTISPNPKEFGIEARDLFDVGDEEEVIASLGSSVVLECDDAGDNKEFIAYQWYKNGLSMFGKTDRTLSISSVKESDYADYTVKITNDYVKEYDQNSNYGEVFTKPIHLVAEPVPPLVEWAKTSYNGKEITLRFSKPMLAAGFEGFSINTDGTSLSATSSRTEGRLDENIVLTLSQPLDSEDIITLDYSGSQVTDKNGGILETFTDTIVQNFVREEPLVLDAITLADGSGIVVNFDKYIDPNTINSEDFTIIREGNPNISSATLLPGDIDAHISKSVLLSLEAPVTDSTEAISVKYTMGELAGFLSGTIQSFDEIEVTNEISLDLTEVKLLFEDGSGSIENVVIQPSWRPSAISMYDDGTNGDEVAGDNIWTAALSLADNSYSWNVFSRKTIMTYDTIRTVDPETGVITLTVTPTEENIDSLLSESVILEFLVENKDVSGSTSFGIMNIDVTFNLTLGHTSDDVFLMGIDEDWSLGIPMEATDENNTYSVTLTGYSPGDIIHYNYRNGDSWENITAQPRSYTVTGESNIINDSFGVFSTSVFNNKKNSLSAYPNPVTTDLFIEGLQRSSTIAVINSSGMIMDILEVRQESVLRLDVSNYNPGIYMLYILSDPDPESGYLFIKK